jgi:hypothetical protein
VSDDRVRRSARRAPPPGHGDRRPRFTGRARSWKEKEAILGAARYTPGVREIDDQIRIDPEA